MNELLGLWIPSEYLLNSSLTGNELKVISYIKYRTENDIFRGGNVEVSIDLKMHKVRVSEAISSLLSKGFLERFETKFYKVSHAWKVTKNVTIQKQGVTETVTSKVDKVTNNVTITESVKVTESVTESYEKRNSAVTENVTLSYIEKHSLKHDNNNGAKGEEIRIINSEKKESFKEKKGKVSKLAEVIFLKSEFKDFNVFEDYIQLAHPDIDVNFYYHKISSWIDRKTGELAKRKIWKNTIQQFLENDYKQAQLVTTTKQKSQNGKQNSTTPTDPKGQAAGLDDLVALYFATR